MISLVLCDDHTLFSDALATVLGQRGFEVRGVTARLSEVSAAIQRHQPDVALVDRRFADGDAIDRLGEVTAAHPETKVVVLTADQDSSGMRRALAGGAAGYVHKTCGVASLTAALYSVMDGEIVVNVAPESARALDSGDPGEPGDSGDSGDDGTEMVRLATHLTARERECLAMLVEGLSTGEMVRRLGIATTTVRTHVQALLSKLGVHSRLEAASLAVRHSLLDDPPGVAVSIARPRLEVRTVACDRT